MYGRHMTGGPNPPISATAVGGALGTDQTTSAGASDLAHERSALDKAELRELERAEYHPEAPVVTERAIPGRRRTLLDRLFRR
jgi:hypothetical protein